MFTLEDVLIAARTVYGEARGESFEGKKAVVHVLLNRTDHKVGDFDHSLAATALRWRQFSAWNENDPNRVKMQSVTVDEKLFRDCIRAVLEAIDEPDPTRGSRHYHTLSISPKWASGKVPVYRSGNHVFYNDVD